jgi:hypothetical protein
LKTIVKRRLDYFGDAETGKASVRVFEPKRDGNAWRCKYRISWPGYERTFAAMGEDRWQALHLAMHIVPSTIFATDDFKKGRIGLWGERLNSYEQICAAFDVKPVEGPQQ